MSRNPEKLLPGLEWSEDINSETAQAAVFNALESLMQSKPVKSHQEIIAHVFLMLEELNPIQNPTPESLNDDYCTLLSSAINSGKWAIVDQLSITTNPELKETIFDVLVEKTDLILPNLKALPNLDKNFLKGLSGNQKLDLCKKCIEKEDYPAILSLLDNKMISLSDLRNNSPEKKRLEIAVKLIDAYIYINNKHEISDDVKNFIKNIAENFVAGKALNDTDYGLQLTYLKTEAAKLGQQRVETFLEIIASPMSSPGQTPTPQTQRPTDVMEELQTVRRFENDRVVGQDGQEMKESPSETQDGDFVTVNSDPVEHIIVTTRDTIQKYDPRCVTPGNTSTNPGMFARVVQKLKPQSEDSVNLVRSLSSILNDQSSPKEKCRSIKKALEGFEPEKKSALLDALIAANLLESKGVPAKLFDTALNPTEPRPAPAP